MPHFPHKNSVSPALSQSVAAVPVRTEPAVLSVTFRSASGAKDLQEVLALRRQVFDELGLLPAKDSAHIDLGDSFDARSWIAMVEDKGVLVGTIRCFVPQPGDCLAMDGWLDRGDKLPQLTDVLEMGKLVIHKNYRGKDILPALTRLTARHALLHGRRYLVFVSNPEYVRYYLKYGAVFTGAAGMHPLSDKEQSPVLCVDLHAVQQQRESWAYQAMFGAPPTLRETMPRAVLAKPKKN